MLWKFETKNFRIELTQEPEYENFRDSMDESLWEETAEKLESGEWQLFCAKVSVNLKYADAELGTSYLGMCIYESLDEFRLAGDYFRDMVAEAITEARDTLGRINTIKTRKA